MAGGRGQHGGGPTPRWGPTCPCLRRRPESEVLVGCSAASVSEASLAFCCVGRLDTREQTNTEQSQRLNFHTELPTRGSRGGTTSSWGVGAAQLPAFLSHRL